MDQSPLSLGTTRTEPNYFFNSMIHLYRGEMNRMTVWRQRLDTTSNWAILISFGMSTFVLGTSSVPHYVLLLGLAILTICLLIEARRYQHLHHSKWRIMLLEHNFFAEMLQPGMIPEPSWRKQLSQDLGRPHHTISWFMAARMRLRRNYTMLLYFITAVWVIKLFIHPRRARTLEEFFRRFAIEELLPSWFVAGSALGFITVATVLVFITPAEETLENWSRHRHAELFGGN